MLALLWLVCQEGNDLKLGGVGKCFPVWNLHLWSTCVRAVSPVSAANVQWAIYLMVPPNWLWYQLNCPCWEILFFNQIVRCGIFCLLRRTVSRWRSASPSSQSTGFSHPSSERVEQALGKQVSWELRPTFKILGHTSEVTTEEIIIKRAKQDAFFEACFISLSAFRWTKLKN